MSELIKILLRTALIFLVLMITIRILGKRELGELSIFDFVILLIIADVASMGIDNSKFFIPSILCLIVLTILQKIFAHLVLNKSKVRDFIDGKPKVLIKDGIINYAALKSENYTVDDLINQARYEGVMDLDEVRLAILETSGKLSLFTKKRYDYIILPVITSGRLNKEMATELKMKEEDIINKARELGYKIEDILYASSDGKRLMSIKMKSDSSNKKR